jgi:tetraacyldisaccharide 4'-kinase
LRLRLDEPSWWYGTGPSAAAVVLAPIAALYGWAARSRLVRTRPYRSRLPVVCVGNLTAGGTGKTPLTLYLCGHLRARGARPAVLTRGYGGNEAGPRWVAEGDRAETVGDEALLLARAAPTLVARDRAAGARAIEGAVAAGAATADVIVMDDGLQNPQLAKDLTLAVVDGRRGLGNGRVIPAGPLRAPLAFQLGRVDALIVNLPAAAAGDAAGNQVADALRQQFAGPVLSCATVVAVDAAWLKGRRVVAWAGIGAPQRFFDLLQTLGAELVATVAFGDHQALEVRDADRLLGLAARADATLVSTAKDMARLAGVAGTGPAGPPGPLADLAAITRVLPIELAFPDPDAGQLAGLIDAVIAGRHRR